MFFLECDRGKSGGGGREGEGGGGGGGGGVGGEGRGREGTDTAFNRVRAALKLYIKLDFVADRTDVGIKSFHTSFHPWLSVCVWHVQYRQQTTIRSAPIG